MLQVLYATITALARIKMMTDMRRLMQLGARLFYTGKSALFFPREIIIMIAF